LQKLPPGGEYATTNRCRLDSGLQRDWQRSRSTFTATRCLLARKSPRLKETQQQLQTPGCKVDILEVDLYNEKEVEAIVATIRGEKRHIRKAWIHRNAFQ